MPKPFQVEDHALPRLRAGEQLSRDEFHRRYEAMPDLKRAELVEGVVYLPGMGELRYGEARANLIAWLGISTAGTDRCEGSAHPTVLLDETNELQPDAVLRIAPGGNSHVNADGFIEGAPELIAEVVRRRSDDGLGPKLEALRRNGVRECIVWAVDDERLEWLFLDGGHYRSVARDADGLLLSHVWPALRQDDEALLRGDFAGVCRAARETPFAPGGPDAS